MLIVFNLLNLFVAIQCTSLDYFTHFSVSTSDFVLASFQLIKLCPKIDYITFSMKKMATVQLHH